MSQGLQQVAASATDLAAQGQIAPEDLGPLTEFGDPTVEIQKKYIELISEGDAQYAAALTGNVQKLKSSLMGATPTAVEEWYTDDVVNLWLMKQFLSKTFVQQLGDPGGLGGLVRTLGGENVLGSWVKIQDIPTARMNQAVRILANFRDQAANMIGPPGVATPGQAIEIEQQKVEDAMGGADQSAGSALAAAQPEGAALLTPGVPGNEDEGPQEGAPEGQEAAIPPEEGQPQG